MRTNYILIDYENVQPKNLDMLKGDEFRILVFVGASQARIPFELAEALQSWGSRARYIRIAGNGSNALDFHIAYYIGELAAKEPDAFFHVISKDTGFDPLIHHLKQRKIRVLREKSLTDVPMLKISSEASGDERIAAIVKSLESRGQSRPRKVKTLTNTVNALFGKALQEDELDRIITTLAKRKLISIDRENVSYNFPSKTP